MELAPTIYAYDRQSIFAASNRVNVPALSDPARPSALDGMGFTFRLMEMTGRVDPAANRHGGGRRRPLSLATRLSDFNVACPSPAREAAGNLVHRPDRGFHADLRHRPGHPRRSGAHRAWTQRHGRGGRKRCASGCISTSRFSCSTAISSRDLARGDLGVSLYTNRPVTRDIAQFLPATLELIFVAGVMMVAASACRSACSRRATATRWIDNMIRLVSLLGVSAPAFVWAVILMLLFAYFLPLFPIAGRISDTFTIPPVTGFLLIDTLLAGNIGAFGNAAWHIVLPAFALALSGIGQAARLTRSNMVETYDSPISRWRESYGFPEKRIASRYAFRPR